MTIIDKTERIHSLDALRAIMMLLGIVLHSAESYSDSVDLLWPKDPYSTSSFFTYLSSLIHIFRMPTFFLISGFFAAMLFYDRSPRSMIKQRFKRVLLPFVIFLLLLHPIIYYSYDFMIQSFGLVDFPNVLFRWLPNITYHLWFLYYLIMITALTVMIALFIGKTATSRFISRIFNWLFQRQFLFILLLSVVLFLLLVWMWEYWASTPLSFMPDIKVFLFYLVFYIFGWILLKSKQFLPLFMRYDRFYLITAFTIYTLKFAFSDYIDDVLYGTLNTIVGWFFVFGFIGIFLRYFESYSPLRRYLSDSSYWVYLIHLPFTLLIPALIVGWEIHVALKFIIVLSGTTILSYLSYHYLVRGSFIGKFLNGKTFK